MENFDESALVFHVPEAERLTRPFRQKYDSADARDVAAHITLLNPFVGPGELTERVLADLGNFLSTVPRLEFSLTGTGRFGDQVLYLKPEPSALLNDVTKELWAMYPDCPPYGGAFSKIVAHLTVGRSPPASSIDFVEREFSDVAQDLLPIDCHVLEASLLVSRGGRWSVYTSFPLSSGN